MQEGVKATTVKKSIIVCDCGALRECEWLICFGICAYYLPCLKNIADSILTGCKLSKNIEVFVSVNGNRILVFGLIQNFCPSIYYLSRRKHNF